MRKKVGFFLYGMNIQKRYKHTEDKQNQPHILSSGKNQENKGKLRSSSLLQVLYWSLGCTGALAVWAHNILQFTVKCPGP